MSSKFTQNETDTTEMKNKLSSILKSTESQYPFNKNNFVSMKKLVFLWIVGNSEDDIKNLLANEVQGIVEDARTIWIFQSDGNNLHGEEIYRTIYEGIDCASRNYLNVDMDHLMICPLFLPGCFQKEQNGEQFIQACLFVQQEMKKRHRYLEWSPFSLLDDEKVDMTRTQVSAVVRFMETIMEDGRNSYHDCCCPCCVIFDVNEKGQEISVEQKVKIIVMLTVFRNTACENEGPMSTVLMPLSKTESDYFFTARAISICEPVKSLMLNRLLAVHNYFLQGCVNHKKIFDDWKHTFFDGSVWKEQLDKLPHDEKYMILTSPIYSNIPLSDGKAYEETLQKFCNRYYFDPLMKEKDKIIEEWWRSFWEEFFLQAAGSIENLDELESCREKIIEKTPIIKVKSSDGSYAQDMRKSCEAWLINELRRQQRYLVENALRPEGRYMQQFRTKKEKLKDNLQKIEIILQNRIRRLRQSEFLLNTGGGHVASPQEEAEHWMQEYVSSEPRKVSEIYKVYQRLLCKIFQSDPDATTKAVVQLFDIYEKIVSGTIESRESYMKTKLANLAGSDMGQLISRLGESWLYPVRLIGSTDQDKAQRLYVMGNKENYLCRKILEQSNYQVAFKECSLDDRLEIVRVSDRLTRQQILPNEQESVKNGLL